MQAMTTEQRLAYLDAILDGLYDGLYPDHRVARAALLDVLTAAPTGELDDSRYDRFVSLIAASR